MVGLSWEGFVIENLLAAAPELTIASFYRTSAGAEVDLVLDIQGHGLWAIDIKRGLSTRPEKGFNIACGDLKPAKLIAVNSGGDSYRTREKVEVIGLKDLCARLAARSQVNSYYNSNSSNPPTLTTKASHITP